MARDPGPSTAGLLAAAVGPGCVLGGLPQNVVRVTMHMHGRWGPASKLRVSVDYRKGIAHAEHVVLFINKGASKTLNIKSRLVVHKTFLPEPLIYSRTCTPHITPLLDRIEPSSGHCERKAEGAAHCHGSRALLPAHHGYLDFIASLLLGNRVSHGSVVLRLGLFRP
jgi:hypothetical protein